MSTLLPSNATELERNAATCLAQLETIPVTLRELVDPDSCPANLLPYLAWAFSVDRWQSDWPEAIKRKTIRDAYYIHAHKGTIGALRRVVEPLGYQLQVQEWFQQEPPAAPGTFSIGIDQGDVPLDEATQLELERLIDDAKPVSRQFDHITINGRLLGPNGVAVAISHADTADLVYPKRYHDDLAPRERLRGRLHQFIHQTLPGEING